jgi:S1-C subfamily serine protease
MTVGVEIGVPLKSDAADDVALVWFPTSYDKPLLEPGDPFVGQKVWAVGFPLQLLDGNTGLQVTDGVLVNYSTLRDRYRTSASFYKGSSGGPLFDEQGRLVGLTVSGLMIQGAIPIDDQYHVTPYANVFRMYKELTDETEPNSTEGPCHSM